MFFTITKKAAETTFGWRFARKDEYPANAALTTLESPKFVDLLYWKGHTWGYLTSKTKGSKCIK